MLTLTGIEKSFGPVVVLRGVDLEVRGGEVHAVLGENGAGKSTLMRILLGIERADRGTMRLADASYAPRGPADARRSGVVMVPQERTLCPQLTVVENIVLGIEPAVGGIVLKRDAARTIARKALDLVAGPGRLPLDVSIGHMGVADQQLVEIARALRAGRRRPGRRGEARGARPRPRRAHRQPRQGDADRLFARVLALKEAGLAIVLVTHFLGDVRAHADRYTPCSATARFGAQATRALRRPSRSSTRCWGRELETVRGEVDAARATSGYRGDAAGAEAEVLLEVRGVAGPAKPSEASFVLRRGELLGIAGLVGSGRHRAAPRDPRSGSRAAGRGAGERPARHWTPERGSRRRRADARPLDRRQHRALEARSIPRRPGAASTPKARVDRRARHPRERPRSTRRRPLRRQPAEGADRTAPPRGLRTSSWSTSPRAASTSPARRRSSSCCASWPAKGGHRAGLEPARRARHHLRPHRGAEARRARSLASRHRLGRAAAPPRGGLVSALATLRAFKRPAWLGPLVALLVVYAIFAVISPSTRSCARRTCSP